VKDFSIIAGGGTMAYWPSSISQYASPLQCLHVVPLGCRHVYYTGNACSAKAVMGHSTGLR